MTDLWLGTLVSPVTFRHPGVLAKSLATLDVLTGGRAFAGVGAGWWEREHAAYGLPFPQPRERLDEVERAIETMRALWGTGTKPYAASRCPRPRATPGPSASSRSSWAATDLARCGSRHATRTPSIFPAMRRR